MPIQSDEPTPVKQGAVEIARWIIATIGGVGAAVAVAVSTAGPNASLVALTQKGAVVGVAAGLAAWAATFLFRRLDDRRAVKAAEDSKERAEAELKKANETHIETLRQRDVELRAGNERISLQFNALTQIVGTASEQERTRIEGLSEFQAWQAAAKR